MENKHKLRLVLLWLLLSALLTMFLYGAGQSAVQDAVYERVRQHLLLTLDEAHFGGNAQNRINDQGALQRVGRQMNASLQNLVDTHWYAPQRNCVVQLQRIDDVIIGDELLADEFTFTVLRNQVEREIAVGTTCSRNGWPALFVCSFLGFLFLTINFFLPPPLSSAHRRWINYLLERGYSGEQAFGVLNPYTAAQITLNSAQQTCVERLHDGEAENFSAVLQVVTSDGVADLDTAAVEWFLLGLHNEPENIAAALALARADDTLVIDLNGMTVSLRGLNIAMSGTPLFYYAWYAMSRINGDGWITNPASNRPDLVVGGELAQLMSRYEGHARAINDLEQAGLKARTLDQNRSKIKDDLVAALGENLALAYLFEAEKHPDGIRMRYRLQAEAHNIRLIT